MNVSSGTFSLLFTIMLCFVSRQQFCFLLEITDTVLLYTCIRNSDGIVFFMYEVLEHIVK